MIQYTTPTIKIVAHGADAFGNYHLRSNGSYNNVPAATSRSSAPGSFYNGTYELTYVY